MWYFKTMLWVWHVVGIIGLLVSRNDEKRLMFSVGLIVLTLGFLGIIIVIEGQNFL